MAINFFFLKDGITSISKAIVKSNPYALLVGMSSGATAMGKSSLDIPRKARQRIMT